MKYTDNGVCNKTNRVGGSGSLNFSVLGKVRRMITIYKMTRTVNSLKEVNKRIKKIPKHEQGTCFIVQGDNSYKTSPKIYYQSGYYLYHGYFIGKEFFWDEYTHLTHSDVIKGTDTYETVDHSLIENKIKKLQESIDTLTTKAVARVEEDESDEDLEDVDSCFLI